MNSTNRTPQAKKHIIINPFLIFFRTHQSSNVAEEDAEKDNCISVSSASPLPAPEINEQIIKSPPEPTRVKSPEQIIMRSPDPVNWTVPLDTGKTFTVTQNVREGECPPGEDGSQILPVATAGKCLLFLFQDFSFDCHRVWEWHAMSNLSCMITWLVAWFEKACLETKSWYFYEFYLVKTLINHGV